MNKEYVIVPFNIKLATKDNVVTTESLKDGVSVAFFEHLDDGTEYSVVIRPIGSTTYRQYNIHGTPKHKHHPLLKLKVEKEPIEVSYRNVYEKHTFGIPKSNIAECHISAKDVRSPRLGILEFRYDPNDGTVTTVFHKLNQPSN